MKAEDFLDDNFLSEYYQGEVFGDFAYPRATVIEAMEKYAEEVLKIAAEKATTNYVIDNEGEVEFIVDKESIINCLK